MCWAGWTCPSTATLSVSRVSYPTFTTHLVCKEASPVWAIYREQLWSSIRALLTVQALQTTLPHGKHKSGRRHGGNTHLVSSWKDNPGRKTPVARGKAGWRQAVPALGKDLKPCGPPGVRIDPGQQQHSVIYLPAAFTAQLKQSNSPRQLHLAPSCSEEMPPCPGIATAQLRRRDTVAETRVDSSGAACDVALARQPVPAGSG